MLCASQHQSAYAGQYASRSARASDLIFTAAYLLNLELAASFQISHDLNVDLSAFRAQVPFLREPVADEGLDILAAQLQPSAIKAFSRIGWEAPDFTFSLLGEIFERLPLTREQLFRMSCGLGDPVRSETKAYFELLSVNRTSLGLINSTYKTFKGFPRGFREVVIAELPISFLASKEDEEKVLDGSIVRPNLKAYPQGDPSWQLAGNTRAPLISRAYLKNDLATEFNETIRVLSKEMPFEEAIKASAALAGTE